MTSKPTTPKIAAFLNVFIPTSSLHRASFITRKTKKTVAGQHVS
jgi:hypothetical protein